MQDLTISLFRNAEGKSPRRETLGWTELCKRLTTFDVRPEKDGPLWSPVSYKKGKTRAAANVEAVFCFVLDYDIGIGPGVVKRLWEAFTYCVHSTFSSTPDTPKFRVVFPLEEPVPAHEWERIFHRLAYNLGGGFIDTVCKDASRIFYLPSHPEGAEHFAFVHAGDRLDPALFEDPPIPVRAVTGGFVPANGRVDGDKLVDQALDKATKIGRDNAGFSLACQLRDNGYVQIEMETWMLDYQRRTSPYNLKGEMEPYTEAEALHNVRSALLRGPREPWGFAADQGRKGGAATSQKSGRKGASQPQGGASPVTSAETPIDAGNSPQIAPANSNQAGNNGAQPQAPATASEKDLAHAFAKEMRTVYMTTDGGVWWEYQGGVWRQADRHSIQAKVERFLEARTSAATYARMVENVTKVAGLRLSVPLSKLNAHPAWISFTNGIIDTQSGEWIEHAPKHLLTVQLPFSYDPKAECSEWMKFLGEMVVDVHGKPSDDLVMLLQEWYGYCLIPDTSAQTSMWWLGGGANGKGVATKVLEALVGAHQRVGVDIEQLHDPYFRADLYGKLLGIVNEIGIHAMRKNSNYFKLLVSGDTMNARKPTQPPFSYEPVARILVLANELPRTPDKTFAYFRRLKIINWRRNLDESQQDRKLIGRLLRELPGIFNWALEGLERLQAKEYHFTDTPESDRELATYRYEEDAVARFIDEWCTREPEAEEAFSELWNVFKKWCKVNGEDPGASNAFSRSLTRHGHPPANVWIKEQGRPEKTRKGIKLLVTDYEASLPYGQ